MVHLRNTVLLTVILAACYFNSYSQQITNPTTSALKAGFLNPPNSAKPGVYWYFMDGNMTKESIKTDLESMKKAGIGNLIFLEVNVGVARGPVDFLSDEWQDLFKYAVRESERLGIEITLGIGPGWTGSGGPWVKPEQSMQHLVSSSVNITGGQKDIKLTVPPPKSPYFGEGAFSPELKKEWNDFYEDVAVLAYPTPAVDEKIKDIDEKALYYRAPYSSARGVKQYLPSVSNYPQTNPQAVIEKNKIVDLTKYLQPDGTLNWIAPAGNWTIIRFGRRNNGAITRPAPVPGLGFEADKFDTVALNFHLDNYVGKLLRKVGRLDTKSAGGLKRLHMDSWEMGSQNWTPHFRAEFIKRRGYDPLPYYPVYAGHIVENQEISERFLWDLRQTSQELILEYHAGAVKKYAHKNGMSLSIEPYDMNPTADLELGAIADVPMSEFWSKGYGFNSSFSVVEATSIAHVNGKSLTPAESFTAHGENWKQHPGSMKNQGDWAFAAGVNRFVYHTFQNQYLPDSLRPGATMGPYGVHWDSNQTWWPMVGGYHQYVSRCSYLLQQGKPVADVLYLNPEGSPHVFRPPFSAMTGNDTIPDRKGYNFDGCSPGLLYKAGVVNGNVVFPGGASYRLLVLPAISTMTPALLEKIATLVKAGATVVGSPPIKSPSLVGYPACDAKITTLVKSLWGASINNTVQQSHIYGKGKVIWGGDLDKQLDNLYPKYDLTAAILKAMHIGEDFESNGPIRYIHRTSANWDMYFIANTSGETIGAETSFRSIKGSPQLWDAVTGEVRKLPEFTKESSHTIIPLQLGAYQSFFVVFTKDSAPIAATVKSKNFKPLTTITTLNGPWNVSFDPKWGGPKNIVFDQLTDWTLRPEEGIKYYSGIATYNKVFDLSANVTPGKLDKFYLDLGEIKNLARVKLNGKDLGVVWTAPWRIGITASLLKTQNKLEIEVANLWPNRLIGDQKIPGDSPVNGKWPDWLTKGQPRPSKRYTFTTFEPYNKDTPLFKSGLIGPVTIQKTSF